MDLPGGRRRWAAGAGALAILAAGAGGYKVATAPPAVRAQSARIDVVDGPANDQHVSLDTTFFTPAGGGKVPAVLLAHGFGGSKNDVRAEAVKLARHGYAVLTWSARGFGHSGGQVALDSPDYEVKDTEQLISWLAKQPRVRLDAPGDPRVGIAGGSYGGGIALMTAAYDHRVDAIVPQITWNDLAQSLMPQYGAGGPDTGVFKKLWAGIFFTGAGKGPCGRLLPSLCATYQRIATTGLPDADAVATLRRSSPSTVADRIKAPTLLIQGQTDSLFPLDQADANAAAIRRAGTPVSVAWFLGGHDGGEQETAKLESLTLGWLDHYLRGRKTTTPAFSVSSDRGFDSSSQQITIRTQTARTYPGLRTAPRTFPLTGGPQSVQNPAGGTPASISAVPGLGAVGTAASALGRSLDPEGQSATFDTARLSAPLQLTGAPTVRLRAAVASGDVTVFVKLYDVQPGGQVIPARSIAAPVRFVKPGPGGAEAAVRLPAINYRFAAGHRIRLVVASTDMGFATQAAPATYRISAVSPLSVPTDPALRGPGTTLPAWAWLLPLAAAIAAVLIVVLRRRPPGSTPPYDAELDAVPLEITGLTKAYASGRLAVDDLSFRVEKGQVLGLLGPNGAGKTTSLRMLMGLIHPDAGEIRIFGHRVTPGAPVLARLGSFVEGPGFLPHLTGRDNLDLYWRATGRAAGESHVDEAVKIADLGSALDRPVRTYSQGMRQRLAIAQAMLGLPDLLVLDEPTNGLDPPQIRAMRDVLREYAEGGRTVIISSHLLAEVEQTCTHVVVMASGRGVAAGPVADIIGAERRLEDAFLAIIQENG